MTREYVKKRKAEIKRRKQEQGSPSKAELAAHSKGGRGKPGVHNARTARRSNLKKMTAAQHNKMHPEKGRKAAKARKRNNKRRKK